MKRDNRQKQNIKFHPKIESGLREVLELRRMVGTRKGFGYSSLVEEVVGCYVSYVKESLERCGDDIDIKKLRGIVEGYRFK